MIILGIDPGFRYTGFGIAKKEHTTVQLLKYGCLSLLASKSLVERIGIFKRFFEEKIVSYQVTHVALETPFLGKNAQNFLKLGYLRGIIYLLADTYNLLLQEFAPCEVKQSITGYGGASKEQVANMIQRLFPTIGEQERADITDALAVTLCGIWQLNQRIVR